MTPKERVYFEQLRLQCTRYMMLEAGTLFFITAPEFNPQDLFESFPQVGLTRYNNQFVAFLPFDEVCPTKTLKDESQRLLNLQRSGLFKANFHKWAKQFASVGLKRTLTLEKKVTFVTAQ